MAVDTSGGLSASQQGPVHEIRTEAIGNSSRVVLIAYAAVELTVLLVVSVVSIFAPPLRIVAAAWLVIVIALLAFGLPRLRKLSRGRREHASLVLDGLHVRYTDWEGKQASCPRGAVQSAVLLLITVRNNTRDLIVFQDAAGAPLMSIPSGLFRAESVDKLVLELGIGSLHRRFINSKADLDAVVPGLELPGFDPSGRPLIDRSPTYRRFVLGSLITVMVFLVVFIVVASRG
jgi:hypothetical protein